MVLKRNCFFIFVLILGCSSCSTGGRKEREQLLSFYNTGAYDQGLQFLLSDKFFNSPQERLLTLMEKGMFLHSKGDFQAAFNVFEEANELVNQMYTISLSKKAEKGFLNDNYDSFYGEIYERSIIYFYKALDAILFYQTSLNRDFLFKARASILGWDSYLKSIKDERAGKSIYKNDLMLKIFGAKIHELIGTREDLNIAKILYKDAEEILFKNYNTYKAFNVQYKKFKKEYERFANLKENEIKKDYIEETNFQKSLGQYLKDNRERLETSKVSKKNLNEARVTLVLEHGHIAKKVAEKNNYGLEAISKEPLVAFFAADVLGLLPSPNKYNPSGAYLGVIMAQNALQNIGITFELPKIENTIAIKETFLNVYDMDKKLVLKKEIVLVNPMSDIAEEALYESSSANYFRVGARLATKHIAAITTSFATYKALGGGRKENDYLARNAALLQYIGASKAIEESEKADTRYWSTLPNELRLVDFYLKIGKYIMELEYNSTEKIHLKELEIKSTDPLLINIRKS